MIPRHLQYGSQEQLLIDGVQLGDIASRYGTPVYVVSGTALRDAASRVCQLVRAHCPSGLVFYAYKANSEPCVCSILKEQGIGAEVSSSMELSLALDIGIEPARIVFNGPLKSDEALRLALTSETAYINADSYSELVSINRIAGAEGRIAKVGLRVGPTVARSLHGRPTRFGIDCADEAAMRCLRKCRELECVRICGIQFHLGTQIGLPGPYLEAITEVKELILRARDENLIDPLYIDIGGGFAVVPSTLRPEVESYAHSQVEDGQFETVLESASQAIQGFHPLPHIIVEPGRLLVASSAVLLTRVVRELSYKAVEGFVVDAGQSMVSSNLNVGIFHDVLKVRDDLQGNEVPTNVFGCLCYESDVIALRLPLPPLQVGDFLAILDCGAYDMALASSFIVPRPSVVLVDRGHTICVRGAECGDSIVSSCSRDRPMGSASKSF